MCDMLLVHVSAYSAYSLESAWGSTSHKLKEALEPETDETGASLLSIFRPSLLLSPRHGTG